MRLLPLLVCLLPLAACQSAGPTSPPTAAAPAPVLRSNADLPSGAGCRGNLARFRAVIDSDAETGNVNKTVYDRMTADLRQGEAFCSAGNDGAANSVVEATKRRYGYPG